MAESNQAPSGPESLDRVLTTTRPAGWWALAVVAVLLVATLAWSLIATLPQHASLTGVVNAETYTVSVPAPATGVFEGLKTTNVGEVPVGGSLGVINQWVSGVPKEVVAPVSGQIQVADVSQGAFVSLGTQLGTMLEQPQPSRGIDLVTFAPMPSLGFFPLGSKVSVAITDPVSLRTYSSSAVVYQVGRVPATPSVLQASSNSSGLTQQWLQSGSGQVYRISLVLRGWDQKKAGFIPVGGAIVSLSRVYANVHPITIVFGGK